jgi:hypothetical protein
MGSGIPRGPVPDVLFPRTSDNTPSQIGVDRVNDGIMMEGVKDQITRVLREFGFSPKGWARVYQKPYLNITTLYLTHTGLESLTSQSSTVMTTKPSSNT